MPTIARFYGIVISMYFGNHPPPHFHARYAGDKARVAIASGELLDGDLPPRHVRLVREWCDAHRADLEANWHRAAAEVPLEPIDPLP